MDCLDCLEKLWFAFPALCLKMTLELALVYVNWAICWRADRNRLALFTDWACLLRLLWNRLFVDAWSSI